MIRIQAANLRRRRLKLPPGVWNFRNDLRPTIRIRLELHTYVGSYVLYRHRQRRVQRTAERCWEISQGTRFLRTPGILRQLWDPHPERCRGLLAALAGCDSWSVSIPGVRKKRVPLANFPAPLRGAEASVHRNTDGGLRSISPAFTGYVRCTTRAFRHKIAPR